MENRHHFSSTFIAWFTSISTSYLNTLSWVLWLGVILGQ